MKIERLILDVEELRTTKKWNEATSSIVSFYYAEK